MRMMQLLRLGGVLVLSCLGILPGMAVQQSGIAEAASTVAISVNPGAVSSQPGQTFSVSIQVAPGSQPIGGVQAEISFPAGTLQVQQVVDGTTMQKVFSSVDNTAGK